MITVSAEFVLGCVLLWFPRWWLHSMRALLRGRRRRGAPARITDPWKSGGPGAQGLRAGEEFTKFANYFDLARAGAGSVLLWGGWGLPRAVTGGTGGLVLLTVCVLAGVLIQSVRLRSWRPTLFPPVFYLAGMVFGVAGWQPALFSFVITWSLCLMLPNAQVFLLAFAVFVYAFGSLFHGFLRLNVIAAGLLVFLPLLVSLLLNRPLQNHRPRGAR